MTIRSRFWFLVGLAVLSVGAQSFKFDVNPELQGIPDATTLGSHNQGVVSGFGTNVVDRVTVGLKILGNNLAFNGDLYATLVHLESGKKAVLLNRVGAPQATYGLGYGDNGLDVTLDDMATNGDIHVYQSKMVPKFGDPITGTWMADGRDVDPYDMTANAARTKLLDQFFGINPNGKWILFIADLSAEGNAKITHWELNFFMKNGTPVTNAPTVNIKGGPTNLVVASGGSAVFNVDAVGMGALSYQWQKDGTNLTDGARINGANGASLFVGSVQAGDQGDYSARVSDDNGSIVSSKGRLSVLDPPAILGSVQNFSTNLGAMITINASTAGSAPLSFQWLANGSVIAGATNSALNLSNLDVTQAGEYSLLLTNPVGTATGQVARVSLLVALDARASSGGKISVKPTETNFVYGTMVELTGIAEPGYVFTGWRGDVAGVTNPIVVLMDTNKTIFADFRPLRSLTTTTLGDGTIVVTPQASNYLDGASVQLQAKAKEGWQFVQWNGDVKDMLNPVTLTMDSNKSVEAVFKQLFKVDVQVIGQGRVELVPAATNYLDGKLISVVATASEGFRFSGWGGDFQGTNSQLGFQVNSNKSGVAYFVPVLEPIASQTVDEGATLSFSVTGTNTPPAVYVFSLDPGAPSGASISTNGWFTWTPTEGQGPSTNLILVKVADRDFASQAATNSFSVEVHELNSAPLLFSPSFMSVNELSTLTIANQAVDTDIPTNSLTFALISAPEGVYLDPQTGILTWLPTEAQGPSTNSIVIKVSDNGSPSLSTTNRITVIVNEINQAPVLTVPTLQEVDALAVLVVTNSATDADYPANQLTFSLVSGPTGASVDPETGVLRWTPIESQGGTTNLVLLKVSDDGIPSLSVTNGFTIVVNAVAPLTPPVITGLSLDTNGGVTIRWKSLSGSKYRIEAKASLTDAVWTELSQVQTKDEAGEFKDGQPGPSQRYYRLVLWR
jgi:uncharacterized repeat protein (TIGR02543 family)